MSSGQHEDLFEVLKQRDRDWLLEALRKRFVKLQMSFQSPVRTIERPLKTKRHSADEGLADTIGFYDVTRPEEDPDHPVSEHVKLLQSFDWGKTGFGPMSSWNLTLRRTVNFVLADPRPATIWWGPTHCCIYNAAYAKFIADKHPAALGKTAREVWPDRTGEQFEAAFQKADATGEGTRGEQREVFAERHGKLFELYGDWAIIPICGGDYNIGYFNSIGDMTEFVHNERQISTLMEIEKDTGLAKDLKGFWQKILEGLESNPREAPFVALYSGQARNASSRSSMAGYVVDLDSIFASRTWTLEGTLGIAAGDEAFPPEIDSEWADENITPAFRNCITTGQSTVIDLTPELPIWSASQSRAYQDQCTKALLCPIGKAQDGDRIGFLILGINSRRVFDSKYEHFTRLLLRQLTVMIATVKEIEDETRKSNAAAKLEALDRKLLSEKLEATAQESRTNAERFRSIAAHLPIAFYEATPTGDLIYGNDAYYEITQVDPDDPCSYNWLSCIVEEDLPIFEAGWSKLLAGESCHFEHRLKKPFTEVDTMNGENAVGETWILSAAFAHKTPDGDVKSIQGALIDISRQKWMEAYQGRKLAEAVELKRQQEEFMDFVGHEIRNPLSATSLCASSILAALEDLMPTDETAPVRVDRETIQSQMENAEIITTCIQHQKRIIDDVLTLSKLDTGLLIVTPCEVKPTELIGQSLRLFDAELQQADMQIRLVVDQSYSEVGIDWAMLDPSRLLQILINLVTNAIRFTKNRKKREITVTMAASKKRPKQSPSGARYLHQPNSNSESPSPDPIDDDDNTFFLMLAVQDTGCGMKPHELQRIFERFQQSSHKTHIDYGGSGLGLFISRELARLQDGQIGVTSTHGKGSTFEFYIKASRCAAPEHRRGRESSSSTATSSRAPSIPLTPTGTRNDSVPEIQHPEYLLLVEDNLVNQKVMNKQLTKAGYKLSLANHGGEALEFLRESSFWKGEMGKRLDLVLMDVEMPIMGGLECTRRIRELETETLHHVPIIAITANARGEQQTQALDAGMDSVVTKPFQMKQLLGEMERVFRLFATE